VLCFLAATTPEQKEGAKGTHGLFARENGPKLSYYDQVDLLGRILKSNDLPPLVHDCQVPTHLLHKFEEKKRLGYFRAPPEVLSLCPGN
jgi:hypothetical protein